MQTLQLSYISQVFSFLNLTQSEEVIINSEKQRLKVIGEYQILDTGPEKFFEEISELIADMLSVPIVVISFIDKDRTWFKSRIGLSASEAPLEWSFCHKAIQETDHLIIEDTLADERFSNNPLVKSGPCIRSYASALLISPQGTKIGALAIMDKSPRKTSLAQMKILHNFADMIIQQLELRKQSMKAIPAEYNFENLNVLIVDDSVDNQNLFIAYLKKYGAKIEIAENGALALDILKKRSFDIILMDIQMPIMDGITAMKEFRDWERSTSTDKTPIIALTAAATERVQMLSMLAGCDVFLSKPVKKYIILDTIKRLSA